jgi:hypothetical protein
MAARSTDDHLWDSSGQITSTGSANAYVIAITEQLGAYYQGMPPIRFKANFTNTGSATANIVTENAPSGIGAATLKKGGGATNLAAGDIVNGGVYTLSYDGTNFQVLELNSTVLSITGFPMSASGDRWGVIPFVFTDGVMEIGRIIDFHNSDADVTDNAVRIRSDDIGSGTDLSLLPSAGADAGVLKRIVALRNATIAQGDVIYYDGTNFVRLAPGTSGQFLQTLGAAANPQWGNGNPRYVESGTVSAAATKDFTIPANCDMMEIDLWNWRPATDARDLFMRFSQSGSFLSGAADYSWGYTINTSAVNDSSDSKMQLSNNWGNAAGEFGHFNIRIGRPSAAAVTKSAFWHGASVVASGLYVDSTGGAQLIANTNAIDGVRFLYDSGNIAEGFYAVRAYRYSA